MMDAILENRRLSQWASLLARGSNQHGAIHESDAELLSLGDGRLLALTVDQVVEEVAVGLYRQPDTVGRIAATAALSDLAAVGADILGLLISVTLPTDDQACVQQAVAEGIRDVTTRAQTHVMGGDTSEGTALSIACTAAGTVPESQVLTRLGASPGDTVFATGPLGLGAALAAVRLLDLPQALFSEREFRPEVRIAEGQALRTLASCCMDTSDGLIATLDQLARLNDVAIAIDEQPATLLHPRAAQVRAALGIDATPMLAAVHGEFELVFAVSSSRLSPIQAIECSKGFSFQRIGVVSKGHGVHLGCRCLDTASIRNLSYQAGDDASRYLEKLVELCS
jgi:thiamine-monophosphate kinase